MAELECLSFQLKGLIQIPKPDEALLIENPQHIADRKQVESDFER